MARSAPPHDVPRHCGPPLAASAPTAAAVPGSIRVGGLPRGPPTRTPRPNRRRSTPGRGRGPPGRRVTPADGNPPPVHRGPFSQRAHRLEATRHHLSAGGSIASPKRVPFASPRPPLHRNTNTGRRPAWTHSLTNGEPPPALEEGRGRLCAIGRAIRAAVFSTSTSRIPRPDRRHPIGSSVCLTISDGR